MTVERPTSGGTYQVLRFDGTDGRTFGFGLTFLRLGFSSQTAIIDFQVGRGENDEISRGLIAGALYPEIAGT